MKVASAIAALVLFVSTTAYAVGVNMTWDYVDNPQAPAVSFSVYRDVGCTNEFLFLGSVGRSTLSYVDQGLTPGATYCYQVTAIGADGKESGASNTLLFQVPLPPPNAPSNLRGTLVP